MPLEFLQNFTTTDALLVVILLILFIVFIKKFLNLIKNVVLIVIAAIVFPIVANRLLGLSLPTDFRSILAYIAIGLAAYVIYIVLKIGYGVLKIGAKFMPKGGPKKGKERVRVVEKVKVVKEPQPAYQKQQSLMKSGKKKSEKELFKNYVEIKEPKEKKKKE